MNRPKSVDFNAIVQHIAHKVATDTQALHALLTSQEGARNFPEQDRLLSEIQAGIRAIDAMNGVSDVHGYAAPAAPPQIAPEGEFAGRGRFVPDFRGRADQTAQMPKIDLDELERGLLGHPVGQEPKE